FLRRRTHPPDLDCRGDQHLESAGCGRPAVVTRLTRLTGPDPARAANPLARKRFSDMSRTTGDVLLHVPGRGGMLPLPRSSGGRPRRAGAGDAVVLRIPRAPKAPAVAALNPDAHVLPCELNGGEM